MQIAFVQAGEARRGLRVSAFLFLLFFLPGFPLPVPASELLDASGGVDVLPTACVEGMVGAVDFRDVAVGFHRRARLELGAVGEPYGEELVVGVDVFSHGVRAALATSFAGMHHTSKPGQGSGLGEGEVRAFFSIGAAMRIFE